MGREQELAELGAALTHAEQGRGGLVLIVGEPGIGKTALAEEFSRIAAERGATLTSGRAWEAGGAPPFWPWIEVVRGLPLETDPSLDAVRSSLGVTAELVPELATRISGLTPPPPIEPAQARFRLFDAVTALLRWASRVRPLVVILDDLHAADPATLSLLLFASRGVRRARVVLVGTFRDVEARLKPAVTDELARIAREGRYLALGRLDRDAVKRLLGSRGATTEAAWVDQLYSRSEGNPLFVVEMLRLLQAGTPLTEARPASLPEGVREVISARLRLLSEGCLGLLELGAAQGRVIDTRVTALALGIPAAEVRTRLGEAVRGEIIAPLGEHGYTFTHVLLREVLHEALAMERRTELHESVARALMKDVASPPLAEIVKHLFEAVPRIGVSEAIAWSRRAARASREQLAFEEAVAFLESAIARMPPDALAAERCDVLLELAAACIEAGHSARGRDAALLAADLARHMKDPERLSRAALGHGGVFTYASTNSTLIELLEEALALLPAGDGELRARLLGRLAAAKQPAEDPTQPMRIAREAIAMARRLPDKKAELEVLQSATSALLYFAEPDERIALDHELLELADRHGEPLRALRAQLRLVFDYLEQGNAARADFCLDAFEEQANRLGHPSYLWYVPLLRAGRAALRGAFAEAEELVMQSRTLADRCQEPNRALTFALHRVCFLMTATRDDSLREESPSLLRVITQSTDPWIHGPLRALIAARFGQEEQARAALTAYDARLEQGEQRMAVGWIAEAAVALSDLQLAEQAYRRLLPMRGRNHCLGVAGCFCLAPLSHPLGMTAALLGRWDEAWQHFEQAKERADALGSPPLRAQIDLDHALGLLRRGGADDPERARALLESAQSIADRLSLPAIADTCDEKLAELRAHSVSRPGPERTLPVAVPRAAGFELVRDGDFWAMLWADQRFQLENSRGLEILARLVNQAGQEMHVTDLLAPAGQGGHVEDAGEVLDEAAIADYRRRAQEIESELLEAEEWNDAGRAAWLRRDLEHLRRELGRAVGLGGRRRKAASTSERARVNVRRRLVHAIDKIEERCPELSEHLRWAVKTGHYCAYYPDGPPR